MNKHRMIRFFWALIFCIAGLSAQSQTFTFECVGDYISGADCPECTGQTTARLFNGLAIKRSGAFFKNIDCPYIIRVQGNNLVITEIIPNPESVTINLLSSGYSTITGFRDSIACMCARQDSSWINGVDTTHFVNASNATSHTLSLTPSPSGGSIQLIEGANVTLTTGGTALDATVTIAATSGGGTDLTYSGTSSPVTLNSSTGTDVTVTAGTGVSLTATGTDLTINNAGDLSDVNEAWTVDADDADTELITTQTVKFEGAGINLTDYVPGTNTVIITGTEIDGSTTNEAWTIDGDAGTTEVISNQTVLFNGAGINTTNYDAGTNTLTITGTEIDGSTTNELQTLNNTSDATSHTVTLSNSGGSVQLIEGANVTLTTGGTGLDGTVTVAATETDGSITNEGILGVSAGGGNDALLTSNTSTANGVTIAGAGIVTVSESTSANGGTITVTGTEVDGSITNEGSLTVGAGGANTSTIISNTSGSTPVTVSGSNTILVTESGSTITLQGDTSLLATVNDIPREPANNIVYGTGTGLDSESWFQSDPTDDNLKIGTITADSGMVNIGQPSGFPNTKAAFYARDVVNLLKYKRGLMPAWYIQQKAVANTDGTTNNVFEIMYNTFAGGNEETALDANFGISMEPHWIAADGDTVSEWHIFFNDMKGGRHRPLTGFFNYHKPLENSWGFSVNRTYFTGNLLAQNGKVSINMTNASLGNYPLEVYKHKNTLTTTNASFTRAELDSVTTFVIGNYNTGGESPQLGLSSLMRWNTTQDRRAQFYLGLEDMAGSSFDSGSDFVGFFQNSGVFREAFRVRDHFGYFGIMLSGGNQPTQHLHVNGNTRITGAIYDSNNDPGTSGQYLSSTVTGTDWVAGGTVGGSGASPQVAYWSGASTLTGNSAFLYETNILKVKNNNALTGFLNNDAQQNILLQNTDATNNNWSSLTNYTSAGTVNAALAFQNVNQSTREAAVDIWAYSGSSFLRMARFKHDGITMDRATTITGAATFSSTSAHNGVATFSAGITANTVASNFNSQVNVGSSSAGNIAYFWNDYSSTSAASSAAFASVVLRNRNATANNWTALEWDSQTGQIAGSMAMQYLDHTNDYGDIVFHTRGSGTGFAEALRITSEKRVGIGTTAPQNRLDVEGAAVIGATYSGTNAASTNGLLVEGNVGIGNTSAQRKLHVTGEVRVTDLATDTPVKIVGADADGDLDTVGISAENELYFSGGSLGTNLHTTIAPATLTAVTNNWNPTGLSTAWIIELSGNGTFVLLTGITAPTFNKTLTLYNTGTNSICLPKEFTTSTAGNRFNFELILFPGKQVEIRYSVSAARWTLKSKAGLYEDVQELYSGHIFRAPVSTTTADFDFWAINSEAAASLVAPAAGIMSGVSVNTGTSATGNGDVSSKAAFFQTDNTSGTVTYAYCKAVIKIPATLSDGTNDYMLRVGFNAQTAGGGATDGMYFDYNHNNVGGNWGCNTTSSGNTQRNNSGIAVTTSTVYTLEVIVQPSLIVSFFINGTRVATNDSFVNTGSDMLCLAEIEKSIGTAQRDFQIFTLQTNVALVDRP